MRFLGHVAVDGGSVGFFRDGGLCGGGGRDGEGGGGGDDFLEGGEFGMDQGGAFGGGDGGGVFCAGAFVEDGLGHGFQAPDEAGVGQELQAVVGRINLPPIKSVAGTALEAVVVIVPALAERDEGEDGAVARIIVGLEAAFAHEMGHGVDTTGAVEKDGRADKKAPNQHLAAGRAERGGIELEQPAGAEEREGEGDGDDEVEAVEPNELGELREVLDLGVICGEIAAAGNPADLRPPETVDVGRVGVVGLVGVEMVMTVVVGPPERAALHGGASAEGEDKLAKPGRAIGFVGEVAVVDAGDKKHPDEVERHGGPDRDWADADPERGQAARVQKDERHDADPIHSVGFGAHLLGAVWTII